MLALELVLVQLLPMQWFLLVISLHWVQRDAVPTHPKSNGYWWWYSHRCPCCRQCENLQHHLRKECIVPCWASAVAAVVVVAAVGEHFGRGSVALRLYYLVPSLVVEVVAAVAVDASRNRLPVDIYDHPYSATGLEQRLMTILVFAVLFAAAVGLVAAVAMTERHDVLDPRAGPAVAAPALVLAVVAAVLS